MSRSNVNLGLSEIICHFEQLEDPRSPINRHHPLPSVLTISLMGVLAGSDGPTAISRWAVAKKDLLIQALDLPHGIPSRDVIRRVLSALKVDAFQSCFACWLNSLRDTAKEKAGVNAELKDHVAIDGKTMKGSHNRAKGLGPIHMVSAWLSEFGLTLAQVATDVKANESRSVWLCIRVSSRAKNESTSDISSAVCLLGSNSFPRLFDGTGELKRHATGV